jgi:hypothetical protein
MHVSSSGSHRARSGDAVAVGRETAEKEAR